MKVCVTLTAIFATAFSSFADFTNSPENFSPPFSTNTEILWQAPTNGLLKSFWIYKILPPHPFSAEVISNAIVLASLQGKGFPQPSTNYFYIAEDHDLPCPCAIPVIFSIDPKSATISYSNRHPDTNTTGIPADAVLVKRAWTYAAQLGIDPAQVAFKNMTSHFKQDENGDDLTNQLCGRGVFLARQLDGVLSWGDGEDVSWGFWIEFGTRGQIRAFSMTWPDLKRNHLQPTATSQQIMAVIQAHRIIVLPGHNETNYFGRVQSLAKAKKFIITKITPYYTESTFGKMQSDPEPATDVMPIAELEAIADFGNSNAIVKLYSPILSFEANRLVNQGK